MVDSRGNQDDINVWSNMQKKALEDIDIESWFNIPAPVTTGVANLIERVSDNIDRTSIV